MVSESVKVAVKLPDAEAWAVTATWQPCPGATADVHEFATLNVDAPGPVRAGGLRVKVTGPLVNT